jgi:HAD superfamily hydrolase (TIGR01509 family)
MDGLMLDTEGPSVEIWLEAARNFGWTISAEAVYRTVGLDEASTRAALMDAYGPDFPYDDIRRELERLITERVEQEGMPHRPGLLPLLDHLSGQGIPLGVATSSARKTAIWKLEKAGILDRFTALACGDEVRRGKPAPDIFILAADRLGVEPADCVGFEDSPAGLRAIRAAGIRSVFVKDLLEPPPEVLITVWRRCPDLAAAIPLFL